MTRKLMVFLAGVLTMALTASGPAGAAETAGPVFIVAYFEAAPSDVARVAAEVRQFAAASRKEPGNLAFDAFQEIGRPSRFAIFDGWQDMAAREAHRAAATTVAYREKIGPMLVGPLEIREHTGFSMAGSPAPDGSGAVYAITHVDVFPAGKDQSAALVTALAEANRKLPGNLWFEVLQVIGHPNHFTLVQGWRDRHAFDNSLMAASTREFRQKLTPLEGALYDERLYHALR
jgi:quinol monooxygenase YgiN